MYVSGLDSSSQIIQVFNCPVYRSIQLMLPCCLVKSLCFLLVLSGQIPVVHLQHWGWHSWTEQKNHLVSSSTYSVDKKYKAWVNIPKLNGTDSLDVNMDFKHLVNDSRFSWFTHPTPKK